jgi:aryl-alcohol dehydrogenase-like predicted oxidoreductase
MNKRVLGRTGLEVSELSLGGLFVSSFGGERNQGIEAIHRALELGVNYIDTAPTYLDSEEVLGQALQGIPQSSYYLSTKLGGRPQPFDPQNKDALRRSVEESLRLLGRDSLDILMIHEPDRPGQYDWFSDWDHFHGPVTELLAELKQEGLIRFTGLGGTTMHVLARIMATGEYDVVLTAFNYSLLWREAEWEILPMAEKMNMGIVCGSPLQQGSLSRRYDEQVNSGAPWLTLPRRQQYKALYAYLDEIDMPLPEVALRFVLSNPAVSTTLMGARSVAEVEQNIAAVERGPLPAEVLARLKAIADMVPFRPSEETDGLSWTWDYKGPGKQVCGPRWWRNLVSWWSARSRTWSRVPMMPCARFSMAPPAAAPTRASCRASSASR